MEKNNIIYRSIGTFDDVQEEDSRTIRGVAIVFDSFSRDLGGFIEKVSRDAISEDFLSKQDIIMNVDHDNRRMLARYNKGEGTLKLSLQDDGLHFEFEAPTTALGDEVLYNVRHGNLFECSFACFVKKDDITRSYDNNGQEIHTIERLSALVDCSIVCHAAYAETEVKTRSLELAQRDAEAAAAEEEAKKQEEEKRNQEILSQLETLKDEFLKEINPQ